MAFSEEELNQLSAAGSGLDVLCTVYNKLQSLEELLASFTTTTSQTKKEEGLLLKLVSLLAKICVSSTTDEREDEGADEIEDLERKRTAILVSVCSNTLIFEKISSQLSSWGVSKSASNTQVSEFLTALHTFYVEVLHKLPYKGKDVLTTSICTVIGFLAASTLGTEHPELWDGFTKLQEKIQQLNSKFVKEAPVKTYGFTEEYEKFMHSLEPPEDFRTIKIIPTLEELLFDKKPFLKTNKIKGAYKDANHYLDVQFRLLREDFVQPLRKGIHDFLRERKEKETLQAIDKGKGKAHNRNKINNHTRVYNGITFDRQGKTTDSVSHHFFLLPPEIYKKINWNISKKLLPGSLVMLTGDFCKTGIFATIIPPPFNRGTPNITLSPRRELSKGILRLEIVSGWQEVNPEASYTMFECEAYFEAYRHNLDILQEIQFGDDNPIMKKFIVNASNEVDIPRYFKTKFTNMDMEDLSGSDYDEIDETVPTLLIKVKRDQPQYGPLTLEDAYYFDEERRPYDYVLVPVTNDPDKWSSNLKNGLGFDENQYDAYRTALTSDLSIIQGPPGTGKTFIGLQIVKTMLLNKSRGEIPNFPILILCYTNHALDQFLELIIKEVESVNVTRIGGQCKSEVLEKHTLAQHRQEYRDHCRYLVYEWQRRNKNRDLDHFGIRDYYDDFDNDEYEEMEAFGSRYTDIQTELQLRQYCRRVREAQDLADKQILERDELLSPNGILNFMWLSGWDRCSHTIPKVVKDVLHSTSWLGFNENDPIFQSLDFNVNAIMSTWFGLKMSHAKEEQPPNNELDDVAVENLNERENVDNYEMNQLLEHRLADDYYYQTIADDQEWDKAEKYTPDHCYLLSCSMKAKHSPVGSSMTVKISNETRNMVHLLRAIFDLHRKGHLELPDAEEVLQLGKKKKYTLVGGSIFTLTIVQRWALYFKLVEIVRHGANKQLKWAKEAFYLAEDLLREHRQRIDESLLKKMDIIGMTTTGAAKHHTLLEAAAPRIVIIEEAAEILEAHIVTSLTPHCQQLVLIGDHLQLRPSVNVYELETKYHMNISLFERMILNNVNVCTLKTQHRMRPEISDLIIGPIYEQLHNHESVYLYPPVKGITKSLYFITHTEHEGMNAELLSKSNEHEAHFMASLCQYLIKQGYKQDQITILTAYTGQMFLMKKVAHTSCNEVRITCIDNYQGEENDIILLSLVRSNEEDNIGFVGIDNRICVSLSRARHGLYIIGNMNSLISRNQTWGKIHEKLKNGENCGQNLNLICPVHEIVTPVKTSADFDSVPNGGCTQICNQELQCSHVCLRPCHPGDMEHKIYMCLQPCERNCERNHPCVSRCGLNCPPCQVQVLNKLPCEHEYTIPCCEDPLKYDCEVLVDRLLSCGHNCEMKCHQNPKKYKCKTPTEKIIKLCGHIQTVECFLPEVEVKCSVIVDHIYPNCHHEDKIECWMKHDGIATCSRKCDHVLPCGHNCPRSCHASDDPEHKRPTKCKSRCEKSCSFGHKCISRFYHECHEICPPCIVDVDKTLPCGHIANLKCYDDGKSLKCGHPTTKQLQCGHESEVICSVDVNSDELKVNCRKQRKIKCEKCGDERFVICCFYDLTIQCLKEACRDINKDCA